MSDNEMIEELRHNIEKWQKELDEVWKDKNTEVAMTERRNLMNLIANANKSIDELTGIKKEPVDTRDPEQLIDDLEKAEEIKKTEIGRMTLEIERLEEEKEDYKNDKDLYEEYETKIKDEKDRLEKLKNTDPTHEQRDKDIKLLTKARTEVEEERDNIKKDILAKKQEIDSIKFGTEEAMEEVTLSTGEKVKTPKILRLYDELKKLEEQLATKEEKIEKYQGVIDKLKGTNTEKRTEMSADEVKYYHGQGDLRERGAENQIENRKANDEYFGRTGEYARKAHENSATPVGKDSNIGATPVGKDSNIGATPVGKDSNIGATPVGKDSNIGATPIGKDSNIGATPVGRSNVEASIEIGNYIKINYLGKEYKLDSEEIKIGQELAQDEEYLKEFIRGNGLSNLDNVDLIAEGSRNGLVDMSIINGVCALDIDESEKNALINGYLENINNAKNSEKKANNISIKYNMKDLSKVSIFRRLFRRESELDEKDKAAVIDKALKASRYGLANIEGTFKYGLKAKLFNLGKKLPLIPSSHSVDRAQKVANAANKTIDSDDFKNGLKVNIEQNNSLNKQEKAEAKEVAEEYDNER